jgi:hypothetical protein
VIVQLPFAGIVALLMKSEEGPGDRIAPAQVLDAVPGNGPALTRPAGNVSEIDPPDSANEFGFVSVIVSVET